MTGLEGLRILLVDDEAEFTATLAERLKLRGIYSRVADCGESGLAALKEESFDAVLLDVMMPGIGGIETLRRIKEHNPGLTVILLTGYAGTKDGIAGMKEGARAYLNKPLNLQELLDILKEIKLNG